MEDTLSDVVVDPADEPDETPGEVEASTVVLARATINLPGLRAGTVEWVDTSHPYVQDCLKADFLVVVEESDGIHTAE